MVIGSNLLEDSMMILEHVGLVHSLAWFYVLSMYSYGKNGIFFRTTPPPKKSFQFCGSASIYREEKIH